MSKKSLYPFYIHSLHEMGQDSWTDSNILSCERYLIYFTTDRLSELKLVLQSLELFLAQRADDKMSL